MSKETFKTALQASRKGDWVPVMKMVRDDPQTAAAVSKLTTAPHTNRVTSQDEQNQTLPDIGRFHSISDRTATNIADAETILEVLPDMDLAKEILVGAIIAPKDMMTTELTYKGGEGIISSDVATMLTAEIKEHFEKNYKIENQLPEILRDIFFRTGSWIYAVIPENSVDHMINGTGKITLESLCETIDKQGNVRSLGILGNAVNATPKPVASRAILSMETFDERDHEENIDPRVFFNRQNAQEQLDPMVSVLDNPDVLKIPDVHRRLREQRVSALVNSGSAVMKAVGAVSGYAAEAYGTVQTHELASQIFKNPQYAYRPMVRVHTQDQLSRRAIGNPLVLHLPSESVMPVYVPGKPHEHIGYFVLLDAEGNPISKINSEDQYRQLANRFGTGDNFATTLLKKAKNQIEGDFNQFNRNHLDISARVFGELVEQELMMRLANGRVYGGGLSLAKQDELYRIMLARALAKQHTQLLFLPVELTTYIAVKYNENGIGESILERMKTLHSLRVMTKFANVAAAMKNSIGRSEVTLKFDEDDPDPMKSFEIMVHEFMRTRQGALPVGLSNPADIVDWMQRAAYEFVPEGNPMLPDVKVSVQQKSDSHVMPDQTLEENLRKESIMAFGVSPEQVDASYNAEFATVANHNNLLLSKRASQYQQQITPSLTEHHRKVIHNTEGLLRSMAKIIETNFDKIKPDWLKDQSGNLIDFTTEEGKLQRGLVIGEVLKQFILSFEVSLPTPNTASQANQFAALEEYEKLLDKALESWIPREGLTQDTVGDNNSQFDALKALVKSHFMRKYMAENGILPELGALITKDENNKPMLNLYQDQHDFVQAMSASLTGLLKSFQPQKDLSNETVQGFGGVSDTATADDDQGNAGTTDDGGGFQDFSLGDDDANPLEAAPDTTAPVEGEEDAPNDEPKAEGDDKGDGKTDDENAGTSSDTEDKT